ITHLLYVPDIDRQYSPENREKATKLTGEAAAWLGYPLLTMSSNARLLIDPFVNWEWSHGGVLAAHGLALGAWLNSLVVASSNAKAHDPQPWGSTPRLDRFWSTEQTRVRVDGDETGRTDKVRAIAARPEAVSRLKVCWQVNTESNCGRCEKCIRTQCALMIAGAAETHGVFEQPFSLDAIAQLPQVPSRFWVDLADSLLRTPRLNALRQAVQRRLG